MSFTQSVAERRIYFTRVFSDGAVWAAARAAEAFLADRGFAVGRMQAFAPRGIMFGRCAIQKWRNLSALDRASLHGEMTAQNWRTGPVRVVIFGDELPREAYAALASAMPRVSATIARHPQASISIERLVADRFREIGHPEADDAAIDADVAEHMRRECVCFWLDRIAAHKEPDEEYPGEADDRGHR